MKKIFSVLTLAFAALPTLLFTGCDKEDPDAIKMEDVNKGIQIVTGADGKEYQVVDLGLTSGNLWATCNMGAASPEQSGFFYAWGETTPKTQFGWETYALAEGNESSIKKYCTDKDYGTPDQITNLEKADDAAYVALGKDWMIPEKKDFNELMTKKNCDVKWCKLNGVGGFLFTSVRKGYEGNSLFIPLAGMNDYENVRLAGQYGWYWCNELYYDPGDGTKENPAHYEPREAYALWLEHTDLDNHLVKSRPRRAGLPIRPVYKGNL